jgi:hypothetical protein
VIIDCLTLTVSAEQKRSAETLRTIRLVKSRLGLSTVLGVSNISFGLPQRPLISSAFFAMAIEAGLGTMTLWLVVEAVFQQRLGQSRSTTATRRDPYRRAVAGVAWAFSNISRRSVHGAAFALYPASGSINSRAS